MPQDKAISAEDQRELQIVFFDIKLDDAGLDPYEVRIYLRLARRCSGNKKGRSWETAQSMADSCKMSRRKVFQAIDGLLKRGMITRISNAGAITHYALTDKDEWKPISGEPVHQVHTSKNGDPCTKTRGTRALGAPTRASGAHMKNTKKKTNKESVCTESAQSLPSPAPQHHKSHPPLATPIKEKPGKQRTQDEAIISLEQNPLTPVLVEGCGLGPVAGMTPRQRSALQRTLDRAIAENVTIEEMCQVVERKSQEKGGTLPDIHFVYEDMLRLLRTIRGVKVTTLPPAPKKRMWCGNCNRGTLPSIGDTRKPCLDCVRLRTEGKLLPLPLDSDIVNSHSKSKSVDQTLSYQSNMERYEHHR